MLQHIATTELYTLYEHNTGTEGEHPVQLQPADSTQQNSRQCANSLATSEVVTRPLENMDVD
jgi:hypothetical protein